MVDDTVDPMLQVALDSGNVGGSNGARNWCVILLKNTNQFVIMYVLEKQPALINMKC